MVAHLPLAIVVVLAAAIVVLWRRTTQQRPVQIYAELDEQSMSPEKISGARRGSASGSKVAPRGRRWPTPSPSSTDCRGGARVGPSQQPRLAAHVRRIAALPLHFRILRRLGVECRSYDYRKSWAVEDP